MAATLVEAGQGRMAFHLRAPHGPGRWLYEAASRLVEAGNRAGGWVLVNDRVDVALASGASGVQLGARSLPASEVRAMAPAGFRIGVSVRAEAPAASAADWLIAGSVYETRSHPGVPGAGLDALRRIAAQGVPVIAVGGVTPERMAELKAAGAAGVAVIRGVWDDPDPVAAVERYLNAWER